MTYAAKIVVRYAPWLKEYRAGFANEMPFCDGWQPISDYGSWYGVQMGYRPFKRAMASARAEAEKRNQGA